MTWLNAIDRIVVINLNKRVDRLLQITEDFENYEIPFQRIGAIEHENGAEGLRLTMLQLFKDCLEKNIDNVLVFEDDANLVVGREEFHNTMNEVMKQLPENFYLLYLGGQPTSGYSNFCSNNLLPAVKYFATHAVVYSRQAMKEIMIRGLGKPIDNWIVLEIQTLGNCYAVNPLLCGQRPGYSDINKAEINWQPFIEARHQQKVNELHGRR